MNCTICNGRGYYKENNASCNTCGETGKVHTMSKEEVFSLMYSSKNANEWEHNCEVVSNSFEGDFPSFWADLIHVSGVFKTLQESWTHV